MTDGFLREDLANAKNVVTSCPYSSTNVDNVILWLAAAAGITGCKDQGQHVRESSSLIKTFELWLGNRGDTS